MAISGLAHALISMDDDEDSRLCRDIPDDQCQEQPRNFILQIAAQSCSKVGDNLANPKVVLPWLLGVVGAPSFLVGLLVPIRESLALLPQILVGGFIRRYAVRKWFWVGASIVEGLCVMAMAMVAFAGPGGRLSGWIILILLSIFSLARGVASVGSKDTLGKTVSKGRRGRVSGIASTSSGIVALILGAYLAVFSPDERPDWILYAVVTLAGTSWLLAAAIYANIREFPGAIEGSMTIGKLARDQLKLLARDSDMRKFLAARALMVSTALAGPILVSLAQREAGLALSSLGWLLLATGASQFTSSWIWGLSSDRSSRRTMIVAAIFATIVIGAAVLVPLASQSAASNIFFHAAILYLAGIAHSGVRIGRKTHIVDLASGDRKAEYVALSNTLIGFVLIFFGTVTSLLLAIGPNVALTFLAIASLTGAAIAATMREVQVSD